MIIDFFLWWMTRGKDAGQAEIDYVLMEYLVLGDSAAEGATLDARQWR